jgi:Kef-type K+ transport system membrane component KefB
LAYLAGPLVCVGLFLLLRHWGEGLTAPPAAAAAALGVMMNTRGLMELVVLNLGLDLGVIAPTLFAMMVLMAVLTTLATAPALRLLGVTPSACKARGADAPPLVGN